MEKDFFKYLPELFEFEVWSESTWDSIVSSKPESLIFLHSKSTALLMPNSEASAVITFFSFNIFSRSSISCRLTVYYNMVALFITSPNSILGSAKSMYDYQQIIIYFRFSSLK